MGIKISGGSVRGSKDGSGGGAITTGFGKGTLNSPQIRTTTQVDKSGNVIKSHTTATVGGKSKDLG